MAVSHIKIDPQGDFTGTVTIFDSGGATATVNATDMVRPSDWNSVHNQYMTLTGNTVGASTVSGSNIVFEGGNNVTLSGNGDTIVFIGGAGVGGGIGLAAGTRTATTANTVLFDNANGITFGLNAVGGSVMTASHNALTTAALSNHSHGNPQLNLTNLTGTTASNSAGFTLSLSGNAAQTNQSAIRGFGVSNTGVTAGNTGISTGIDWVMAGSQSITLSQSTNAGGPNTIWIQHPAWITTGRASTDGIGLATALTAGPLAWTVNSAGLSLNAGSAAGTTSGFAGTNISGSITHNTAGINIALSVAAPGGGGNTVTMFATSNTTQSTSGTLNINSIIFAGAGAASVGISNGSVVISAPNAAAGNVTFSAGTTSNGLANVEFANSNQVSFGLNGSTITASFNPINIGVSTMGNTAGTTGTVDGAGAQYLFVGSNNITMSQSINGQSVSLSMVGPSSSSMIGISGISLSTNGNTVSFMEQPQSSWVSPDMALSVLGALGNGSYSIAYRDVNVPITATRVDCPFAWNQASSANANTIALAMTVLFGIYTRNASTLNTVSSATTQTTFTYASNSAGNTQLIGNAYRPVSIPVNVNMSRGNYYFGFGISTAYSSIGTATTTAAQTISVVGVPQGSSAVPWTDNFTRVTGTSVGMFSGHGIYSAAVSSVVPAISLSAINQSGSYFHRANIALVFRG